MSLSSGRGFGIVGLGSIADFHAKAIQAMDGGRLLCAFSRNGGERAEKFAAEFGVEVIVGDYDRFLKTPGLEIVTIATPSGSHLEPAVAAANAKKHVVSEKPMEINLERCDAMIDACAKNGVTLGGVFQSRSTNGAQAIRAALDQARFGRLTVCTALIPWHRTQAYYDSGGWRGTWKLDGGGALMNQSIHQIDLLQWFAGPVSELTAYADCLAHERIEVEDSAVAALRFKSGALGAIVGSTAMYPGQPAEVQISGEKGSAWLKGGHLSVCQFEKEEPGDAQVRIDCGPPKEDKGNGGASDPRAISFVGHQRQFENFVASLNGGSKLMVDGTEARKAVEIILAVYKSAREKTRVTLPLDRTPELGKFE